MLIWCCDQRGTYILESGETTCADGVDVDHVRAPDGQWWKFQDITRAVVRGDGEVAFYSRVYDTRIFDPMEDQLTTRWGPVSNCGMEFGP